MLKLTFDRASFLVAASLLAPAACALAACRGQVSLGGNEDGGPQPVVGQDSGYPGPDSGYPGADGGLGGDDAAPSADSSTDGSVHPPDGCTGRVYGSECVLTLAQNQINARALAAAGMDVYWLISACAGAPCAMSASSYADGVTTVLGNVPSANLGSLAVGGDEVYWTNTATANIQSVSTSGGAVADIDVGDAGVSGYGLAVNQTTLYFLTGPSDGASGSIASMPIAGGTPTIVASGLSSPAALNVVGSSLYWLDTADGYVMTMPTTGGHALADLSGITGATGLAVDGTNAYWITRTVPAALMRAPLSGDGPVVTLYTEEELDAVAVDANNVYVTDSMAGNVYAISPK